ncbi:glutathione transferase omega-1 [Magnaporthiopsis poae ATCC 64411]|uniref:Glutathione transferase omega-1 n=1 Tax=Magnaporthiopsis poae (strain ATCC 64411 / 73-15) TaxID=644358 RepID=A0A0C4DUS3_MAGP6|nr:glutathione transferase omega-1 [Magnaporthiopsis poae ATCC 64411]
MSQVDTSIHEYATGRAAELVKAHAAEHPLKLYSGWFCPFVQRAWMVLEEKRIPYQYIEINPYHKSPEFLALNPRGLVPTLAVPRPAMRAGQQEQELKPLYESIVLCEYLDEAFADEAQHGPCLMPRDPYERARCRIWIDHISNKIVPSYYKLLQHTAEKPYSLDQARQELHDRIKTLVREMAPAEGGGTGGSVGPWFLGGQFSLVDVSLAPWAKSRGAQEGDSGDADGSVWRRWRIWFDAVVNRPCVANTWSDDELYIAVYKRYAEDTTNSLVGQATRKGEKLP